MQADASRRWLLLSWLMPLAMLAVAVAIPLAAEAPVALDRAPGKERRFGLELAQRRTFFGEIARLDAQWRARAERAFPADPWAQADHWTDLMSRHVRQLARQKGVSLVPILLAWDEGLHERWRGPGGRLLRTTWPSLTSRKR